MTAQTAPATPLVTEPATPLAVALAFTEAWTGHDLATAARYVADDVVFGGPVAGHVTGIRAYMDGLAGFAQAVIGLRVVAAFGDDAHALIMYEVTTGPFGTLLCAEYLTVQGGKIQMDKLTFDTYKVRTAAATQAPPTGTA